MFRRKGNGYRFALPEAWRAHGIEQLTFTENDEWQFLISRDLSPILLGADRGGLKGTNKRKAIAAAGEDMKRLVTAGMPSPRAEEFVRILVVRHRSAEGDLVSGKEAKWIWKDIAPERWKEAGKRKEPFWKCIPEEWLGDIPDNFTEESPPSVRNRVTAIPGSGPPASDCQSKQSAGVQG